VDLFTGIGAGLLTYGMTTNRAGYTWAGAAVLFLDIGGGAVLNQIIQPLNSAIIA